MTIREQITNYKPFDEQEQVDKEYFLDFIDTFDDVLTRDNKFGHFCASAFVVNEKHDKMVVVYHIINDGWMYPGGHADGETNFLEVAVREVLEETGLKVRVLDKNIFGIQANPVQSHIKNNKFISAHTHYDVIYLLEADEEEKLEYREDESKGVKWINLDEAEDESIVSFAKPVHKKMIKKLSNYKL